MAHLQNTARASRLLWVLWNIGTDCQLPWSSHSQRPSLGCSWNNTGVLFFNFCLSTLSHLPDCNPRLFLFLSPNPTYSFMRLYNFYWIPWSIVSLINLIWSIVFKSVYPYDQKCLCTSCKECSRFVAVSEREIHMYLIYWKRLNALNASQLSFFISVSMTWKSFREAIEFQPQKQWF